MPLNRISWLCFCVLVVSKAVAQSPGIEKKPLMPLAPNAAEFNKYGAFPVSTMTGTPQISFPIYTINTGKIEVPISLSYHASGIKVNQAATWVGLAWSLNCNNTISRSVRGIPDEELRGWLSHSKTAYDISQITEYDTMGVYADNYKDSKPDFYSYSIKGKSGGFAFKKATGSYVPTPHEPIVITRLTSGGSITGSGTNNTFEITDDDGTRYVFGQKQLYTSDPAQDPQVIDIHVQTWFLTKIISYDRMDTVVFKYKTTTTAGASNEDQVVRTQSRSFWKDVLGDGDGRWHSTDEEVTNKTVYVSHSYVALEEIGFRQGKVVFHANTSRVDYRGTALDSITVYSKGTNGYDPVYRYAFNYGYFTTQSPVTQYDYRLKLLSFQKKDLAGGSDEVYRFEYNDVKLPSTISLNQDFWGYNNGSNNGDDLLPYVDPPHPSLPLNVDNRHVGNANRFPSDTHVMAGTLAKITYPTNGYTVFEFEPHRYKSTIVSSSPLPVSSVSVTGVGKNQLATATSNFLWPATANITGRIKIVFSPHTNPAAIDVAQRVIFRNLTTGTNQIYEHMGDFSVEQTLEFDYTFNNGHSYQMYLLVDDNAPTKISVNVTGSVSQMPVRSGGGIRIKSIRNFGYDNKMLSHESYTYRSHGEDNIGVILRKDVDLMNNYYEYEYVYAVSGKFCDDRRRHYIVYVSNTNYPSVTFEGSPVVYQYVTKTSFNNGLPNGKTVYEYDTEPDISMVGNSSEPGGFEIIDNTLRRVGRILSEKSYGYNKATGAYNLSMEKYYNYNAYLVGTELGVSVWRKVVFGYEACDFNYFPNFGIATYTIREGIFKLTGETQILHDLNGSNSVTKSSVHTYGNTAHLQPTEIATSTSTNDQVVQKFKYPGDHTTGDEGKVSLDKLQSMNRFRNPYLVEVYQNTVRLAFVRSVFDNTWTANDRLVLLKKQEYHLERGPTIKSDFIEYKKYNEQGSPLEVTDKSGIVSSYIWDFYSTQLVAHFLNAPYGHGAFSNFEAENHGGWLVSGLVVNDYATPSGSKCLSLGSLQKSGLNSASTYVLSYAYQGGTVTVSGGTLLSQVQRPLFGGWTFVRYEVSGATSISISGSGSIDHVALYPKDSQLQTYAFRPLVGVTSITDVNGVAMHYEYDPFGRVVNIKDDARNIVKNLRYNLLKPGVPGMDRNFVVANDILIAGVNNTAQVDGLNKYSISRNTAFFDGVGRGIQNIGWQASPDGKDVVKPIVYDSVGRLRLDYLPYVSSETNGWLKQNPVGVANYIGSPHYNFYNSSDTEISQDERPYSQNRFESNPLNRPQQEISAGEAWSNKPVKQEYGSNSTEEVLLITYNKTSKAIDFTANGALRYYAEGELFTTTTIDEHGNETIEFVDKKGQVIERKVQYEGAGGTKKYAETYYVYDDFGKLMRVLPPEAMAIIRSGAY